MPADTLTHFRRRRDGCRIQLSSSPALPSPQPQTGKEDGSPRLATARHCRSELELGVRTILLGMPSMPSPYFGISLHYSALCTLHSALSPPRPPPYPTHTHSPPHHSNNHQMHSNNTPTATPRATPRSTPRSRLEQREMLSRSLGMSTTAKSIAEWRGMLRMPRMPRMPRMLRMPRLFHQTPTGYPDFT